MHANVDTSKIEHYALTGKRRHPRLYTENLLLFDRLTKECINSLKGAGWWHFFLCFNKEASQTCSI